MRPRTRTGAGTVSAPSTVRGAGDGDPTSLHGVWLVRHAPTSWTGRRWCGRADPPLTGAGREVAAATAAGLRTELGGPAVVRSSPARRARATAETIAVGPPVWPLELDDDLLEIDFGAVEGRTWDEVGVAFPRLAAAVLSGEPVDWPDGESRADVAARAGRAADRIVAAAAGSPVVVVAHGAFIAVLRDALRQSGFESVGAGSAEADGDGAAVLSPGGIVRLAPVDRP